MVFEREGGCIKGEAAAFSGSRGQIYDLIRRAQAGEEDAREILVLRNGGLVSSVVQKFAGMGTNTEDLLQMGYIGLLKAIDRFDLSYGVMFSTYAVPLILGEIRRFLRDDGAVKMSRQKKQQVRDLKRAREALSARLGRSPRISELAEVLQLRREDLVEILAAEEALGVQESLDDPERFQEEEQGDYREEQERQALKLDLNRVMSTLKQRERQIIVLRYFRDMTQQQIADRLQISQVQVSRLEKKILASLREALE